MKKHHQILTNDQAVYLSVTGTLIIDDKIYFSKNKRYKTFYEAELDIKEFDIIVQATKVFILLTPFNSKIL